MKKIIILIIVSLVSLSGYLFYDWWHYTDSFENTSEKESIYSWVDENGMRHYSDGGVPAEVEDVEVTEGYTYVSLPIVYRVRNEAIRIFDKYVDTSASDKKKGKSSGKPLGFLSNSGKHKVVIYTTSTCKYCKIAKEYFDKKNIRYTEQNISLSSSAMAEFQKIGGRGVPMIIINGNKIQGFNRNAIEHHLQ